MISTSEELNVLTQKTYSTELITKLILRIIPPTEIRSKLSINIPMMYGAGRTAFVVTTTTTYQKVFELTIEGCDPLAGVPASTVLEVFAPEFLCVARAL